MRKNTANYIISLVGLTALNIVYFIWQPYPKSIIRLPLDVYGILDMLTNLIYFIVNYFVLVWIISGSITVNNKQDKKSKVKNSFIEIGVFIVFELVLAGAKIFGENLFGKYAVFVCDVSMIIRWIFTWGFLLKRRVKESEVCQRKKSTYIILAVIIVLILLIAVISDFNYINKIRYFVNKYGNESETAEINIRNIKFLYEIKMLALDTLTGIIFFSYAYFMFCRKRDDKTGKTVFGIRFFMIVVAMFAACWVKSIIFPHSLLSSADGFIHTSSRGKKSISISDTFISLYRVNGYNKLKLCYEIDFFRIYKGNKIIKIIVLPFNYASGSLVETYKVEGIQVKIYPDYWLMFRDGGDLFLLELDEIKGQPENNVLIGTCEIKIEEGNFEFFEHGYEYLLKYDPDFIKPYIERYSNGDFTEEELELNAGIRPEFIQELAEDIEYDKY